MEEATENKEAESKEEATEVNPLDESKAIVEEMKKANEEKKALLEREEKLTARKETLKALGGDSEMGKEDPKPTEEEKKKQEAKEFWAGTDIEKAIEKYG